MPNRKTPCDSCGSRLVEVKYHSQIKINGMAEGIYEERCVNCRSLLFGWSKPVKTGSIQLI